MCSSNDASIQINTNLKTYLAYGTDVSVVLTSHYFSSQVDALLFFLNIIDKRHQSLYKHIIACEPLCPDERRLLVNQMLHLLCNNTTLSP